PVLGTRRPWRDGPASVPGPGPGDRRAKAQRETCVEGLFAFEMANPSPAARISGQMLEFFEERRDSDRDLRPQDKASRPERRQAGGTADRFDGTNDGPKGRMWRGAPANCLPCHQADTVVTHRYADRILG